MPCDTPFMVENKAYHIVYDPREKVPVPCNRCPFCIRTRVNQWIFRLEQEMRVSKTWRFVTLTYRPGELPITDEKCLPTLCRSDLRNFLRRLRRKSPDIKYYAVGEYGSLRKRPHYHLIIFNLPNFNNYAYPLIQTSKYLESIWKKGFVHTGDVTTRSMAYTLKYIDKDSKVPSFIGDDRIKEFSVMSKGIGANYLSEQTIKFHRSDLNNNYVVNRAGYLVPLPRYYRDKKCPDGKPLFDPYEWYMHTKQIQMNKEGDEVDAAAQKGLTVFDLYNTEQIHKRNAKQTYSKRFRRKENLIFNH